MSRSDSGLAMRGASALLIQGGFNIAYNCDGETPMMFMVHVHPERERDLVTPETVTCYPNVPTEAYIDGFGNKCLRLTAPTGRISIWSRFTCADDGRPDELPIHAYQHAVQELPENTLVYLLGSRYCDTDKLPTLAWSLFGQYWKGWPLVVAILNYVHSRIRFDYQCARGDRTAFEAHEEQVGVCRDYAHLAIALCRCMNIPARYCTGYMGDIGVPSDPAPMDFNAWFEIYMGGRWWTLDARHNKPRIGRILMARGRDAADVAISTAFGQASLCEFQVITEEFSYS